MELAASEIGQRTDERVVKKRQNLVEFMFASRKTPARHYETALAYSPKFLTFADAAALSSLPKE
jgi:hypothetical protein